MASSDAVVPGDVCAGRGGVVDKVVVVLEKNAHCALPDLG